MTARRDDHGAIAFAEKLLTVLAEGGFVATYKYAVLLALMDLCLEYSTRTGSAPSSVTTRQLAEKVLELYWPHTMPYGSPPAGVLKQSSDRQARILSEITSFREKHAPDPSCTLTRARLAAAKAFDRLVKRVEWKLVEMPLPRVQVVGTEQDAFLYTINWSDKIKRGEFNDPTSFDNAIRFVGEAGDHLVRLSGLLRPLIQREWTSRVARYNADRVPELGLEQFLFGVDRISLQPLRTPLLDLHEGLCFYCRSKVPPTFEIDHFVPWSRYPNNAIENLVIAHRRCNGFKSDHLAAHAHVERWRERSEDYATHLDQIASELAWDRHAAQSIGVARAIYLGLPADALLWRSEREFVRVDDGRWGFL